MQKTYLFYDLETTGLNKCFDQVLQFAAIRTDLELNELERHEIMVKLNPDVIPTPKALLTHGISIKEAEAGISEYEAICEIHQLLNQPGTISLGYNTLGFDDEFLRFCFYRNLLTPYTHQYANGCSRMDIYPMTVMYYLYQHGALRWPEIDGKISLKLENISAENDLMEGSAHDAMVDVKATIELARKLIAYKDMWQYLCGYFDKNIDLSRMAKLSDAIMVDGGFGAANQFQIPVLNLGTHNHYKNQTLWLRLDLPELRTTQIETIAETTYVTHKKPADLYLLLPSLERYQQHLSTERLQEVAANKKWLQEHPELLAEITAYYKEYKYPLVPKADIDSSLYQDGFLSNHDQSQCLQFHNADITHKIVMLEKFSNTKLRDQALRVLGRNFLDALPENYISEVTAYLARARGKDENAIMVDYKNQPKYSPQMALAEITILREDELTREQHELLDELESYIKALD